MLSEGSLSCLSQGDSPLHSQAALVEARSLEGPLPPARGGGPQSSTTPCPSRTDTALLIFVLEFSRSVYEKKGELDIRKRKRLNTQEFQVLKSCYLQHATKFSDFSGSVAKETAVRHEGG